MVDKSAQSTRSKLISNVVALAAAMAAQKGIARVWMSLSGHQPPHNDDRSAGLGEVIAAAVITGAVMALVRVLAARGAAHALDE